MNCFTRDPNYDVRSISGKEINLSNLLDKLDRFDNNTTTFNFNNEQDLLQHLKNIDNIVYLSLSKQDNDGYLWCDIDIFCWWEKGICYQYYRYKSCYENFGSLKVFKFSDEYLAFRNELLSTSQCTQLRVGRLLHLH